MVVIASGAVLRGKDHCSKGIDAAGHQGIITAACAAGMGGSRRIAVGRVSMVLIPFSRGRTNATLIGAMAMARRGRRLRDCLGFRGSREDAGGDRDSLGRHPDRKKDRVDTAFPRALHIHRQKIPPNVRPSYPRRNPPTARVCNQEPGPPSRTTDCLFPSRPRRPRPSAPVLETSPAERTCTTASFSTSGRRVERLGPRSGFPAGSFRA